MKLYRLKLRPLSAWRTPWQADTLAGLLCWACARTNGSEALRQMILDPACRGEPCFVLSDAFPSDVLPMPEVVRLLDWPGDSRKLVKRARWLRPESFRRAQNGEPLTIDDLVLDDPFLRHSQTHNTLDRFTDTTGEAGSLFQREETWLKEKSELLGETDYFTVYVRVKDEFRDTLLDLFNEVSLVGFGADVSAGKGQFELVSQAFEPADWLDEIIGDANAVISLSTFQPADKDPTEGYWQSFVKYGKLGPDFGLDNVFKRPLVMLRPGACFKTSDHRELLGRAIPMEQLLSEEARHELTNRGASIIHLAYGLALPARLTEDC
jgi:CRISPR-associated protein Csm4